MNVTLKPFDFAQAVARAGLGIGNPDRATRNGPQRHLPYRVSNISTRRYTCIAMMSE